MFSNMYPSLESIQEYLDNEPDKPYIMCEYSHCMGNGPAIWRITSSSFRAMMAWSAVSCGSGATTVFIKGRCQTAAASIITAGDHNEWPHDGNFCMDGLVYPDRRPHTGLLEFKNVYRPARVVKYDRESGISRCITTWTLLI